MIPKAAVKQFLDQPRDDHRWLKDLTHDEVDLLLSELEPPPTPWRDLFLHQKVGLLLGLTYPRFAWWFDLGTGKTLLTLEVLQYLWDNKRLRRALVFVTSDKAFPTWEGCIARYKITVPFIALDARSSIEKWSLLETFGDGIVLAHYPGTLHMVSEKVPKPKGKGQEMVLSEPLVKRLLTRVDALVLDESTKVSNHQSLTYKLAQRAAKQARYAYALSGMPFGRDPSLLWPQCKLIDGGESLGGTLGLFRSVFFSATPNWFAKNGYAQEYTFKKSMEGELSRVLQHRSLTFTANECIDLPEMTRLYEELRLPPTTLSYYESVVDEVIEAKGNFKAMKNAFLRMRQLSSGFLGLKDDETGDKVQLEFKENPKLDRLLELIEEMPAGRKAVVFYEFTRSGQHIKGDLEFLLGIKSIWLWSGTKDPRGELARFMQDPATRVAVVNNKVGAYSLDGLQVANYMWFFESPVSAMDRVQAERRILRQGQVNKVFIGDLIVKDTVDAAILGFHAQGKDLFKSLLAEPGLFFKRKR